MKRKFLLIIFFSAAFFVRQVSFAQIITNGGFENWSVDTSGYLNPVGWYTNNNHLYPAAVVQAPGRTGNYSAKFVYKGFDFFSDMAIFYGGSIKPLQLSGYFKGNCTVMNDYFLAGIAVADSAANVIGLGSTTIPSGTNLTNWTSFSFPINYSSSATPHSTVVRFLLFAYSPATTAYIDDLSLTYVIGMNEIQTVKLLVSSLAQDFSGNYFLNLNLLSSYTFAINIFSSDGKKVSQKNYSLSAGQHQINLSTQNLSQGIYFCRVAGEGINKSFKFIK